MAESPLESGPVVGTSRDENIAAGYQKLGNVVAEPVQPGVTGADVERVAMARVQALQGLANGIEKGFSPLIGAMIQGGSSNSSKTPRILHRRSPMVSRHRKTSLPLLPPASQRPLPPRGPMRRR